MKWIKLKDRKPCINIDGDKVLIYRILNKDQESQSISIFDTKLIKYSNDEETWWMSLPDKPKH